jgi:hypothetical protein
MRTRTHCRMEAVERAPRLPLSGAVSAALSRRHLADFGVWAAAAALVVYLALRNGGYDVVARSEVGVAAWWIVLVGTAVGVLPAAGGTRLGRIMLALLAAVAAWTAISLAWTESAERTMIEVGRTAAYLGFFALALGVQRAGRWRYLLYGLAAGVAVVTILALLSRLEPSWFPEQDAVRYFGNLDERLLYPLNYASGLAAFLAIGIPLLLGVAYSARTRLAQSLAAAALPATVLALWLTGSGQAPVLVAGGVLAFLILAPDRLPKLATLLFAGAGSAILIAAEGQREAFDKGLTTAVAEQQGDELLVYCLVVCAGVGLAQAGVSLAVQHGRRPRWLSPTRPQALLATTAVVLAAIPVALAAGLPGELSDAWDRFNTPPTQEVERGGRGEQVLDVSANRRTEIWRSALDANATEPLIGIGAGTFEFWWTREDGGRVVRDAHSLYFQALAETGIIGLVLIAGFSIAVIGIGAVRAFRAPPGLRTGLAAATAGSAVFVAGVLVDWTWELGAVAAVFMGLAAIAIVGGVETPPLRRLGLPVPVGRIAVVALSLFAIAAIVIPLAGARALADSQTAASEGDLAAALDDARHATEIQPYSASAHLQEALILERQGDLPAALAAAREATADESTNWRTWLIVSRIEAELGNAKASVDAYERAYALNPTSPALAPGSTE